MDPLHDLYMAPSALVETCWWTSRFPRNPWQDGPLPNAGREATARFRAPGCYQAQGAGPLQRLRARGHCKSERAWPLSSSKRVPLQRSRTGPMQNQLQHFNALGHSAMQGGQERAMGVKKKTEGVRKKGWGSEKKTGGVNKKRLGG